MTTGENDVMTFEHARDIDDRDFLRAVRLAIDARGMKYATRWDVSRVLHGLPADGEFEEGLSEKVVLAKAKRLVRRGLLDACTCGCRGDLELTPAGVALLEDQNASNDKTPPTRPEGQTGGSRPCE